MRTSIGSFQGMLHAEKISFSFKDIRKKKNQTVIQILFDKWIAAIENRCVKEGILFKVKTNISNQFILKFFVWKGEINLKKKVLIFCDVGIDDAIALIYAYLVGNIQVVGIVAGYGNIPRIETVRNARYLLQLIGRADIPVFSGAITPMTGSNPTFYSDVHGQFGLGPIQPDIALEEFENFCDIIPLIETYQQELTIITIGRLTSLATLCLLYQDLMKNIPSYYIMGGAFLYPGNVTPVAEANFYEDPVAANIVMKHLTNISIYPLNVTQQAIVTPDMVNYIHSKGKTKMLKPLLDYYFQFYQKQVPGIQGSPVHDALTLMAVNRPDFFTYYSSSVDICTATDSSRGQSIGDFRITLNPEVFNDRPKQQIAMHFHYEKFYTEFMTVMTGEHF